MKGKSFFWAALFLFGFVWQSDAGSLQRIGHTTLTPRHSLPDDKGMYAAVIDPVGGYAYFFGNYLFKLDITGNLPVMVGTNIQTGQSAEAAIDPAGGFAYLPKGNGLINRYALGSGNNSPASAGSLTLPGSGPVSIVIDDSDPNPTNHYGYVLTSGTPAKVVKVALSNFTAVSSVTLNAGENNFAWGQIDTKNGYAYFASYILYTSPAIPQILKIKLTPGTNAPIRIGTVNLGATPVPLWTSSIDTLHGYAYYSTDNGTTNIPETVFKVKLGDGDALPTPVPFGGVSFHTNEVQIISQIIDPVGGYIYFNDDNTYPGRVYQFTLNGTNPPVELGYLQLQGGTQTPPPNGITANNTTTNADGIVPFGEVFLRSAVFDPVRGFAYIGQDCRPNQVVKIQVARDVPVMTSAGTQPGGVFQFSYTNTPGVAGVILAATNAALPATNWTALGTAAEISSGLFVFADLQATNSPQRFYRVRSP
ncbi:MAG: hypothetical protein JWQ04_896 [Pedosphaera sp.]|nr:hypothetical protein [Pedosphaera sp.]